MLRTGGVVGYQCANVDESSPPGTFVALGHVSSQQREGAVMDREPKMQEPEIMPPVPKVAPGRNSPEIPPDKDAPEETCAS